MCSTCGCSGSGPTVTDLTDDHDHDHAHGPGHDHDHAHGPGHDHDRLPAESSAEVPATAVTHQPTTRLIELEEQVLAKNDLLAARNRGWFDGRGIVALNLMSSPGAGKTSLLERTIRDLSPELAMSVTEGEDKPLKYPHMFRAATCWCSTSSICCRT